MGYLQNLKNNIYDLLRDDKPFSSLRYIQFLFFTLFSIGWFIVTLTSKPPALADIPEGLQVTIGLLLTGKVLQKGVEVYQDISNRKNGDTKKEGVVDGGT